MNRRCWVGAVCAVALGCGDDAASGGGGAPVGGGGAGGGTGGSICSVDTPGAQATCDDGNTADDDGCDADCQPSAIVQIAAGPEHTCVLTRTGAVRCWGRGDSGRLGYGNEQDVGDDETPASAGSVALGEPALHIAVGFSHSCAALASGAVRCWGDGGSGRLGTGSTEDVGDDEAPEAVPAVDLNGLATQVSAGEDHSCALLVGGAVRCWGGNAFGQLGYGHTMTVGDDESPSTAGDVAVGGVAVQVAAGFGHTCALIEGGDVTCWGRNDAGQLGYAHVNRVGDDELPQSAGPVMVGWPASSVAAAYASTCALSALGAVRCWGNSANGECGYASTMNVGDGETPASQGDVDVGGVVVDVNAGPCALLDNGTMRCWGWGATGALGHGNTASIGDDETPASAGDIDLGAPAVLQHSDGIHACALLSTGDLVCWGANQAGQLGYGHEDTIGDDELPSTAGAVNVF